MQLFDQSLMHCKDRTKEKKYWTVQWGYAYEIS